MTRLILTNDASSGLEEAGRADIAVSLVPRFVWGPLPSDAELAAMLAARTTQKPGSHWLDYARQSTVRQIGWKDLGLIEVCQRCETVELWFDPDPNHQLQLIWLLDYFHSHPEIVARLRLRLVDYRLITATAEELGRWKVADFDVTKNELETASSTWRAYRATTPEVCFELLNKDLSALPLLRPALHDLFAELPSASTGPGATEMRMLELIAWGYANINPLFHFRSLRRTRIFNETEHSYLLEGLAHVPTAAVAGLDEELRTIERENLGGRHTALLRSRLSLTEFGRAVVAHKEDFSRHNPIDRWWGGTHLTNDRLWRYAPILMRP
jgi:hypothetical protein